MNANKRIWLCLALIVLTGCLEQQNYHLNDCDKVGCNNSSLYDASKDAPYALGYIEIDDQGMFWDREQFEKIKHHAKNSGRNKNLLIYVYVHGWQHNAAETDSNVINFRQQLSKISQELDSSRWNLLGIYVGWRGRSIDIPILEYTTFWDRQSAAKRVADGSLIEVFSYLNALKKQSITETRMITLGHSFGGAIVFSTLNKLFTQKLVESSNVVNFDATAKGIGDLTILINPAFDALKYAHFHDMEERYNHFWGSQKPILAIFTSQQDWATKFAFPIGNTFARIFESTRYMKTRIGKESVLINQNSAARTAIGHFKPYTSHDLVVSNNDLEMDKRRYNNTSHIRKQWEQGLEKIKFSGAELISRHPEVKRTPYLVVSVEPELIPNHNDFNGREFEHFLHEFIMMSAF